MTTFTNADTLDSRGTGHRGSMPEARARQGEIKVSGRGFAPAGAADARCAQFKRALDWAEAQELIASHEIDDVVYLRLCSHEAGEPNE
jgi:hypothetical protein